MSFLSDSALPSKTVSNVPENDTEENTNEQVDEEIDMQLQEDTSSTFNECQHFTDIEKSVSSSTTSLFSFSSNAKYTSESLSFTG